MLVQWNKNEKSQQLTKHLWSGIDTFWFGRENKSRARRDSFVALKRW